jgi:hypothetical protein
LTERVVYNPLEREEKQIKMALPARETHQKKLT